MALTISKTGIRSHDAAGLRRRVVVNITGPSSYSAGGESLTAADVGLGVIEHFPATMLFKDSGDMIFCVYDYTNAKLVFYTGYTDQGSGDYSSYSGRVEIIGR